MKRLLAYLFIVIGLGLVLNMNSWAQVNQLNILNHPYHLKINSYSDPKTNFYEYKAFTKTIKLDDKVYINDHVKKINDFSYKIHNLFL